MSLDMRFLSAIDSLRNALMGTERVAPLLYELVRFTRPRSVLEVGMGYTSPFLVRGLADNWADTEREQDELRVKSAELKRRLENGEDSDNVALEAWVHAPPAFAIPSFYANVRRPTYVGIDRLTTPETTAGRVKEILDQLDLASFITIEEADFRDFRDAIPSERLPFDFVWFDVGDGQDYADFFNAYWPLINPNGGVLLMHYMLTNAGPGAVLAELKRMAAQHPDAMEVVSLLEPHKCGQNSVTMIKKISDYRDVIWEEETARLKEDALRLVSSPREA